MTLKVSVPMFFRCTTPRTIGGISNIYSSAEQLRATLPTPDTVTRGRIISVFIFSQGLISTLHFSNKQLVVHPAYDDADTELLILQKENINNPTFFLVKFKSIKYHCFNGSRLKRTHHVSTVCETNVFS